MRMFSVSGAVGGAKAGAAVFFSRSRDWGAGQWGVGVGVLLPQHHTSLLTVIPTPDDSPNLLEYPQKLNVAPSSPL